MPVLLSAAMTSSLPSPFRSPTATALALPLPNVSAGREGAGAIVQVDRAALIVVAHGQVEITIVVDIPSRYRRDGLAASAERHGMRRVEVDGAIPFIEVVIQVNVAALLRRTGDDVERAVGVHIRQRQAPVRGVSRRCAARPCLSREILQRHVSGWSHRDIEAVFRREHALAQIQIGGVGATTIGEHKIRPTIAVQIAGRHPPDHGRGVVAPEAAHHVFVLGQGAVARPGRGETGRTIVQIDGALRPLPRR